jgi:probable HAF family extracellular repeat protein
MNGLGDLPDGSFGSLATGVSADGAVVVGWGNSIGGQEAFRWTNGGGMIGLGDLAGGSFESVAHDVSSDGTIMEL